MTDEHLAELQTLDAEISENPGELQPLLNRRWLLCRTNCDWKTLVEAATRIYRFYRAQNRPKRERWRAYLVQMARADWRKGQAAKDGTMQRFYGSDSVAAFDLILENSPDLARWRAAFPPGWNTKTVLEHATGLTFCVPNDWRGARADELKAWALAIAIARDMFVAAEVYTLFLDARYAKRPLSAQGHARRAHNFNRPDYEQLAHLNLAIEAAPDNANWHARRGGFLRRHSRYQRAIRDFTRAIELAPDQAHFYEARAKAKIGLGDKNDWWRRDQGAVADYARAIELHITRGEIADDAPTLAAQGAQATPPDNREFERARAIAFYSLAIEKSDGQHPITVAQWHLARAQLLESSLPYHPPATHGALRAAHRDVLRALMLAPQLDEARGRVIRNLRQQLARKSSHERLEALFEVRQQWRDFGLDETLVHEIIAEVERALAA